MLNKMKQEMDNLRSEMDILKEEMRQLTDTLIRKEQELIQERCKRRAAEILSGAPKVWQPENHHLLEE